MMRRAPLCRSPMRRGTRRVGQAARERVRAGGKLAVGRPSLDLSAWRVLAAEVTERAERRCEVPWCRRREALHPHHCRSRSQGGPDTADNVLMLCAGDHRRIDFPYRHGRLITEPLGGERFRVAIETRDFKGAPLLSSKVAIYQRRRGT